MATSNPSQIFEVHAADLCDIIIDCNPHRIVNKLVTASLVTPATKKDVKSTSDVFDKADKIVEKLQKQVDEHGVELLKKICDFLLEQTDETLKDIGRRMMSQLPDIPYQNDVTQTDQITKEQRISDPSQIFRVHADDLCDIIAGCNRHRIVNKLVSASLVTPATKEDVKSTHDVYDKADIIVEKLQRQVDEHGVELLKKICDFLLEQTDKTLKDIGTRMMSQLPDITISHKDSEHVEETNERSLINDFPVVDQQHFREALNKSGAVKTRISKAIVQGPARVGKTSVKSLILSQPYKSKISTGCCESPDIAVGEFAVSRYGRQKDEYHWELVDSEAMLEKFASEIRDLMSQQKKENTVESSNNSKEIKELPVDDQTSYTADTPDDDLEPLSSSKLSHPAKESVAAARVGEMDFIHMVNKAQGNHEKLMFYKEWLYFIDCGGQIQFQQLVQAFIPCASVLMLVTSLAENLSSQCSASFQYEEDKSYDVSDYLPSNETLLRHLTLMVSSSSFQQELVEGSELSDVIKIPEKLKVLIVATHRDLYEERLRNGEQMETIDEKEETFKQIFMHIDDNLVFLNEKIFFEVDGRNASQQVFDDPAIKEIRAELRDQAFKVDIPLSWYAFEILLRERSSSPKGCGVLSLKDCETIGFSFSLKKEEVQSALKFFHLLNTILYYPGVSDLVFINPHCLIDVIHELVVFVCESRRDVKSGRGTAECRKVVWEGKISKDVLNTISKKCSQISKFFPDHNFSLLLIRIFKHLLIATESPNKRFFMPALLPLTDPSQFIPSSYFSLLFYFKKGVPLGLFCAMIVNLLLRRVDTSDETFDNYIWLVHRTSKMFSNLITLQHYYMKGKVVFVESNDCFEVHFQNADNKEKGEKDICSTLNDTIQKRKFDSSKINYKKASFCPCPKKSRHAAILHTSGNLRCTISGDLIEDPDRQSDTDSSKETKAAKHSKGREDTESTVVGESSTIKQRNLSNSQTTQASEKEHNEGGPTQRMSNVIGTDNSRIQQNINYNIYNDSLGTHLVVIIIGLAILCCAVYYLMIPYLSYIN